MKDKSAAVRPSGTRTPKEEKGQENIYISNDQRKLEKRSYQSLFTYKFTEVCLRQSLARQTARG